MAYGTLSMADLLATTSQTVVEFGEDRIFEVFSSYLEAHNRIFRELAANFCETTTEYLFGTGGVSDMEMQELDEFGTPDAQKVTAGESLGLPLRHYESGLQWTRRFFEKAPVSMIAAQMQGIMTADVKNLTRQIKRAFYLPTNYSIVDTFLPARPTLNVKRLANADSFSIPSGPNGETFDASTHTHYLANATLTKTVLDSLIATVREHFNDGEIVVEINQAQEATIRTFTPDFVAYIDGRVTMNNAVAFAGPQPLTFTNIFNRTIGIYNGAEVRVKPWAVSGYVTARHIGTGRPVLGMRVDTGDRGLNFVYQDEKNPLRCSAYEHDFGVGVINRVGAAVLYIGGGAYVAPTIN